MPSGSLSRWAATCASTTACAGSSSECRARSNAACSEPDGGELDDLRQRRRPSARRAVGRPQGVDGRPHRRERMARVVHEPARVARVRHRDRRHPRDEVLGQRRADVEGCGATPRELPVHEQHAGAPPGARCCDHHAVVPAQVAVHDRVGGGGVTQLPQPGAHELVGLQATQQIQRGGAEIEQQLMRGLGQRQAPQPARVRPGARPPVGGSSCRVARARPRAARRTRGNRRVA